MLMMIDLFNYVEWVHIKDIDLQMEMKIIKIIQMISDELSRNKRFSYTDKFNICLGIQIMGNSSKLRRDRMDLRQKIGALFSQHISTWVIVTY